MAASRFELDWPAIQLLVITVLAFAIGLAGCGPLADSIAIPASAASVPSELAPYQGAWKFDEARTAKANGVSESPSEVSAEDRAFLDAMKTLGVTMSNIEFRGTQITQQGGILQAQYDLLDYRSEGNRIVGTALWHQDRHDAGDCTEIKVTLERDGETLIFSREVDDFTDRYYFTR
jgi:hypothetical protein